MILFQTMFLRCLSLPVTMTSPPTALSGICTKPFLLLIALCITKCEGTMLVGPGTTLSSMFSKDGKTPEWCSGQCLTEMLPKHRPLLYPGSGVFTTRPWSTSMASLSLTTQGVTFHSRPTPQTSSDTRKSKHFGDRYLYKQTSTKWYK